MDYAAILILASVFIPLERLLPLHPEQGMLRRNWANDLFYLLFNGFVVRAGATLLFGAVMAGYRTYVDAADTAWVAAQPIWAQATAVIVIADIGYYIAHRSFHAVPFLWKFHSVHHSVEEMDWLATHRVHPVDQILSSAMSLLPVYFIGFSPVAIGIYVAIYHAQALLSHSNVKLNFGPLKYLIASPEYHHWHHANQPEAYDRNFAAQLSIIDLVAGTIFMPRHRPEKYGLTEPMPRFYHQQMLYPIRAIFKSWTAKKVKKDNKMNKILEDNLGKLAMLIVFGFMAYRQTLSIIGVVIHRETIPMWQLNLTALIFGTIFLFLILYFTVNRLPPRDSAAGIEPRVTASAGTFIMMLLIISPPGAAGPELRVLSAILIILGTILSVYCIRRLGKSFSIMATARELVTEGPYKIIRHPLYGAEVVTITGMVIGHWSPVAAVLGLVWLALQIRRVQHEERILRDSFPEYSDYARRVPMLLPGFMLPSFGRA